MALQRVREAECLFRGGDWGVKYLMRGPRIDWGVIRLKPGQSMGAHSHGQVEETFYVLEGTPRMVVDSASFPAAPGDAFRVEAPAKHDIHNESDGVVRVLFIKCPYLPQDKKVD